VEESIMKFGQRLLVALIVVLGAAAPMSASGQGTGGSDVKTSSPVGEKVNINTADVKALMRLSGIGRSVAERIVQYRDTNGPFKKPEELRKVEGVGAGLWERNRERIVVK
jgi:competence protein ComEA